jgi:hypothetical protein
VIVTTSRVRPGREACLFLSLPNSLFALHTHVFVFFAQ